MQAHSHQRRIRVVVTTLGVLVGLLSTLVVAPALPARADYQPHGFLFAHTNYDYAPSIIQSGALRQYWWCGYGPVPGGVPSGGTSSDVIYYRTYDSSTGQYSPIQEVLTPTNAAWDAEYTCDPSVIEGHFTDPENGRSYTYALYYSGTNVAYNGRIGVAFSNDGVTWVKYSQPVIFPAVYPTPLYGAGQPSTYNYNGQAGLDLFYTDTTATPIDRVYVRTTTDGIHFSAATLVTNNGIAPPGQPTVKMSNSDYAYDTSTATWYAAIPLPARPGDRETYQFGLYKMDSADVLGGTGTWTTLGYIDTDLTGGYLNHSPGLVRDGSGRITPFLPSVEVIYAMGGNDPATWDLASVTWRSPARVALNRYVTSAGYHWVTGGYVPAGGYTKELTLGYVEIAPVAGTRPIYDCATSSGSGADQYVSLDYTCEGAPGNARGIEGFLYSAPPPGITNHALYRCKTGVDHFVSSDPNCEGTTEEELLGYAANLPS